MRTPVFKETATTVFAVMLAGAGTVGCGPSFDPVARLTGLRVLAVRAQPVNPLPDEITALDALIYAAPDNAEPVTYSWSWCPKLGNANDGYRCPVTDEDWLQIGSQPGIGALPPQQLGTDPTQPFRNPFPTALLADLCARGFVAAPDDCRDGFPIRVNLTVTQSGAQQTATTVLRLPAGPDTPLNANPSFDGGGSALAVVMAGVEQPLLPQTATVTLPRLKETDLRTHVADATSESYPGLDDNGGAAILRERLVLSWYVETGDVTPGSFHTGYFPRLTYIEQFLSNKWKPGKKASYPWDQARLIVVLRDNRGGVAWTSGTVALEPAP